MDRTRIVAELRAEIQRLQAAVSALEGGKTTATSGRSGKRHLSAEARERIAAAQRKRWAKFKKKSA